jgi:hypothetical protein
MAKKKPAIEYPEDVIAEAKLRRMKPDVGVQHGRPADGRDRPQEAG